MSFTPEDVPRVRVEKVLHLIYDLLVGPFGPAADLGVADTNFAGQHADAPGMMALSVLTESDMNTITDTLQQDTWVVAEATPPTRHPVLDYLTPARFIVHKRGVPFDKSVYAGQGTGQGTGLAYQAGPQVGEPPGSGFTATFGTTVPAIDTDLASFYNDIAHGTDDVLFTSAEAVFHEYQMPNESNNAFRQRMLTAFWAWLAICVNQSQENFVPVNEP